LPRRRINCSLVLIVLIFYILFFFFQAEDGIRDKLVTGVQTCALPIYVPGKGHGFVDAFDTSGVFMQRIASRGSLNSPWGIALARSEERRVGKECRCGGGACD